MKKLQLLLIAFIVMALSACHSTAHNPTDFSSADPVVSKKQYMTHDETQTYEWKCDIAPAQIKTYKGSPLEGYFITVDGDLYAYNAQTAFEGTDKHYQKVDTDLRIAYLSYHYQLDELTVLTEDFKTYAYDQEQDTFTPFENDFGNVIKAFSERGRILSWGCSNLGMTNFWFMDKKGEVYTVAQKFGTVSEYTQTLKCTFSTEEKILSTVSGIIKTDSKYYYFDLENASCYSVAEEATAVYDNIAFMDDLIVLYKDDPTHIYDHTLIYKNKFVYR